MNKGNTYLVGALIEGVYRPEHLERAGTGIYGEHTISDVKFFGTRDEAELFARKQAAANIHTRYVVATADLVVRANVPTEGTRPGGE